MRQLTDAKRLQRFMRALGHASRTAGRIYFAGGASAVLMGWRESTIDIDLELDRELEPLLRDIAALKESLQVNVELATPGHFIPEVPGWRERSALIAREGPLWFHHYDFYAQALAKIERGHARDELDVTAMVRSGVVDPSRLLPMFEQIAPELYRYPALDATTFRRAVTGAVARLSRG
jgi:hypothetical protein